MQEDVIVGTVINILEVKINPNTLNDNSIEKSTFSDNITPKNSQSEPVYVNSDVNNTYLKIFISKVHLSEYGIRLSIKVLWNILKNDRTTEDWIGYYITGLY